MKKIYQRMGGALLLQSKTGENAMISLSGRNLWTMYSRASDNVIDQQYTFLKTVISLSLTF